MKLQYIEYKNCPTAIQLQKCIATELPFELALALERELQAQLFASSDAKEGLNAYVEKRAAEFTGD